MKLNCALKKVGWFALMLGVLGFAGAKSTARAAEEIKLSATEKGIEINAGAMGTFIIQPPFFSLEADKKITGTWKISGDDEGEVTFPNGLKFKCKVKRTEIDCSFRDLPREGKPKFMFLMGIPLSFNEGGKYKFDKKLTDFPAKIETEQFLVTGISSDFSFADKNGLGLTIEVKSNWFGLQDNRVWNSNEYSYQFLVDLAALNGNGFVIKIKPFKP